MNETSRGAEALPAKGGVTPVKGLLTLTVVAVVVVGFMMLTHSAGIRSQWGGFLFLFYWAGVEQARVERLPACCGGALAGLAMCYALWMLPASFGAAGYLAFIGALLVAIYCLILGWLPVAINLMTMLYLTVGSIPVIQADIDFTDLLLSLLLGCIYFGGLAGLGHLLSRRKAVTGT